jgi:hypothetical protein
LPLPGIELRNNYDIKLKKKHKQVVSKYLDICRPNEVQYQLIYYNLYLMKHNALQQSSHVLSRTHKVVRVYNQYIVAQKIEISMFAETLDK